MKHGLTLGKYAPFHKGHQFVIETALQEMDEVSVIIYDAPEVTTIPLNVRSKWIKKLCPQVRVIEAWDGPTEVGDTDSIKRKHEAYIINHLKIQDITHFYSSEFYGEHMSTALKAVNLPVDPFRGHHPISGRMIRENPFKFRAFISPIVYRDLITNVVFLGAPSTGKTTIARVMAKEYKTEWMPEYGREYWELNNIQRRLTLDQLVEISRIHLDREEKLLYNANQYLFTDTNAITTYMFSLSYHQRAAPELVELANLSQTRYDIVFLCDVDIPYDDTWDRSGDVNRIVFQKQIIADLAVRKIHYFLLSGDLLTRVERVKSILSRYRKFASIATIFQEGY
jgi:HTH-type transcriptional regulator, transcriptional repressor of NAD biosynthesis genes